MATEQQESKGELIVKGALFLLLGYFLVQFSLSGQGCESSAQLYVDQGMSVSQATNMDKLTCMSTNPKLLIASILGATLIYSGGSRMLKVLG